MTGLSLVLAVVITGAADDGPAAPERGGQAVEQVYRSQAEMARRDADAHARLALWCEANGLTAERAKHLAAAVLIDPNHALARGLLGLVRDGAKWREPAELTEAAQADPESVRLRGEYEARRARTPATADAQSQLAQWCESKGLAAEARAHWTAVTRLDPGRESAWKKLGYTRHDGRWMTEPQRDAARAEERAQALADKAWQPKLETLRARLGRAALAEAAGAELARIEDPRAVPSIWKVFAKGNAADQRLAVQLLGQIDSPAASWGLALLAVSGKSPEVRRMATEVLTWRDPRTFVDGLIARIRRPIRFEVKPVGGPGSPGELYVEGQRMNLSRRYGSPSEPFIPLQFGDRLGYDADGLPVIYRRIHLGTWSRIGIPAMFNQIDTAITPEGANRAQELFTPVAGAEFGQQVGDALRRSAANNPIGPDPLNLNRPVAYDESVFRTIAIPIGRMILESRRAAATVQQRLESDVAALERFNALTRRNNEPILMVLEAATGQRFGDDPEAWAKWWSDEQGYAFQKYEGPRATVVEDVAVNPNPVPIGVEDASIITNIRRHSCFAAGTPVTTRQGVRPIEDLAVGDEVLVQDLDTGGLRFEPILTVFHNPPNQTLRVDFGEESIVATPIHRFWKAGHGWVMARELEPGDRIRALRGLAEVKKVEPAPVQRVFNLEVASGRSFFVGAMGFLVHDNSLVEPVEKPFDAVPSLAADSAQSPAAPHPEE